MRRNGHFFDTPSKETPSSCTSRARQLSLPLIAAGRVLVRHYWGPTPGYLPFPHGLRPVQAGVMTRLLSLLMAVNSAWFAALHVLWALGWRWGIPDSMPPVSEWSWFLVYDVVAAVVIFGLVVIAARIVTCPLRARSDMTRRMLVVPAAVCACRGVPGVVGDVLAGAQGTWTLLANLAGIWFVTTAGLAVGVARASRWDATPVGRGGAGHPPPRAEATLHRTSQPEPIVQSSPGGRAQTAKDLDNCRRAGWRESTD